MTIDYRNFSDEELMHRVQNNKDSKAQQYLFKRYKHMVLGVLLQYLQDEDAAIEGTTRVFEKMWIFAQKKHIVSFQDWIHNASKIYATKYLKKHKMAVPKDLEIENNDWEYLLNLQPYNDTNKESFKLCMESLSQNEYNWLDLFYNQEKSISEIATLKGISSLTVLENIQAAKRVLKICMHQRISK